MVLYRRLNVLGGRMAQDRQLNDKLQDQMRPDIYADMVLHHHCNAMDGYRE